eukprot:CAMPEP_0172492264 /NCGR_PEP_ID=MMETSP1066-20121228/23341_1 /TAXON_ID=671091 /ORGANISM="Coscinodiscus wailesii, Strain CCMP2513" /LENGTH=135 /DNA_ID=CAMNT_0013261775 /DNA_START=1018 /DNA_END=1426 /DNA_ORIENTATION=+
MANTQEAKGVKGNKKNEAINEDDASRIMKWLDDKLNECLWAKGNVGCSIKGDIANVNIGNDVFTQGKGVKDGATDEQEMKAENSIGGGVEVKRKKKEVDVSNNLNMKYAAMLRVIQESNQGFFQHKVFLGFVVRD